MEYEIIYSARRTLSLCLKGGALIVRAPYGTSREKIAEAVKKHSSWVEKHLVAQRERAVRDALLEARESELRALAKELLPEKVKYYARLMGVKYGKITVTGAKTRFGSCSSAGNISFSYRLMGFPEAAIDYVVVHELAHVLQMNHSPRFYALVEKVLPDYKRRRALLKE